MGQEIAVTPLQLITAHAALANGGMLMNPMLVKRHVEAPPYQARSTTADGWGARVVSRVVSEKTARWIVEGPLREVVRTGTGKKARLREYAVFGKTGTAQKIDPNTGGYSSTKSVDSFVCGAPADDPRVLVLVVVDEPSTGTRHTGGMVAAPAASQILRKTLIHLRVPTKARPVRAAER